MTGGMFAMYSESFLTGGSYDQDMEIWGGEVSHQYIHQQ
jgi:hypothetical protein